jgi:uncharacterized membrane-anchored protein YhcB (DUF1043 family)
MLASISTLIQTTATDLTTQVVIVLGVVIGIAVGYFLFRFGWRKLKGSLS